MTRLAADQCGGRNVAAFLDTIAFAEGVARFSNDDGYDVIVGGSRFSSYADHPGTRVWLPRYKVWSSAAGRYQFIRTTWDGLKRALELADFGPTSQDRACIALLQERGAYRLLQAGRFDQAVGAASRVWASLPGAGYGQREQTLDRLREVYIAAGGRSVNEDP